MYCWSLRKFWVEITMQKEDIGVRQTKKKSRQFTENNNKRELVCSPDDLKIKITAFKGQNLHKNMGSTYFLSGIHIVVTF